MVKANLRIHRVIMEAFANNRKMAAVKMVTKLRPIFSLDNAQIKPIMLHNVNTDIVLSKNVIKFFQRTIFINTDDK